MGAPLLVKRSQDAEVEGISPLSGITRQGPIHRSLSSRCVARQKMQLPQTS